MARLHADPAAALSHLGLAVLRVSVYRGGELIGAEHFRTRHIIVGRDPTMADLVIGSGKVSREHALVEHDGNRVFVHDLMSTNGIYLNGLKVDRAEVGPGDVVLLGEHFLRLELRGRAATPEPEPEPDLPLGTDLASLARGDDELIDMRQPIPVPAGFRFGGRGKAVRALERDGDDDDEDEPWRGPIFSLVTRLMDDQPTLARDLPRQRTRLAILKTREESALDLQLVQPGRRYRAPALAVRERWGTAARNPSPFAVRWLPSGAAEVQVPERSRWTLRRGVGLWDEAAGVREGWARRRRGVVWITLQRNEMLTVTVNAITYAARFVPAPKRLPHDHPAMGDQKPVRIALAASAVLHAIIFGALALHAYLAPPNTLAAPVSWLPHDEAPPIVVALPSPVAGADETPLPVPAVEVPVDTSVGKAAARPPGGSQGYRFFGLIDAPISYDPQIPAPGPGVTLKRAAAFLRGDGTGFGQLIPQSGPGPQWRWVPDPQGITSSDPARLPAPAAGAVVAQNSAALQSCYERALPRDAGLSGRVSLSWLVVNNGTVRTVFPGPQLVEPPLLNCLTEAIKRWHYSRFTGPDVTLSYTLVFKRVGFE